jgi:proteasome accessory factor C
MDRLQRIYKLHQILSSARYPVSRQLLEEKLESSTSSIKRIIEELRLYFNAPIKYDREHNGYFYDASEGAAVELPGLWFNANELYALLTVQQFTVQLSKDEIAKRIRILQMTARKPANVHFQAIASALLQRKRLQIHYHSRSDDQATQRPVSPQRLTHYRDNWYLDAFCHKRNALRSFAVDRISMPQSLGEAALDFTDDDLDAHFASSYGIFAGKPKAIAVLLFSPERARWVADEQWHPQQQSKRLANGSYELRIPYANASELAMDILKHGAGVEVIEPAELRQEVIDRLRVALEKYS